VRLGRAALLRPSPQQQLLLRAVFVPERFAREAWDALRPSFDLDHLEEGSYGLMPLLERRLSAWGTDEALALRLRGIYRHTWYRGNVLLERLKGVIAIAAEQQVDVLVTGEPRLLLRSYRDSGLRPATRLDLLVAAEQRDGLAAAVESAGWSRARSSERTAWLERPDGPTVALHRWLAPQRGDEPWRHAVTLETGAKATSPTDELLRICAGEERRFPWYRLQWLADADALIQAEGGEIEWDRLVETAAASAATLRLRDALRNLRKLTDAAIPADTHAQLESGRPGMRERLLYRLGR
jgi:Uncharacterised nucleotidyltransferase